MPGLRSAHRVDCDYFREPDAKTVLEHIHAQHASAVNTPLPSPSMCPLAWHPCGHGRSRHCALQDSDRHRKPAAVDCRRVASGLPPALNKCASATAEPLLLRRTMTTRGWSG
jgi:hypothetical protein